MQIGEFSPSEPPIRCDVARNNIIIENLQSILILWLFASVISFKRAETDRPQNRMHYWREGLGLACVHAKFKCCRAEIISAEISASLLDSYM